MSIWLAALPFLTTAPDLHVLDRGIMNRVACNVVVGGRCVDGATVGGSGGAGGDANVQVIIIPRGGDGGAGGNAVGGAGRGGGSFYYVTGLNPNGDNWLALRNAPSFSAPTSMHMGPGTLLTVLGSNGEWYRVRLQSGETGWANSRYIRCCRSY